MSRGKYSPAPLSTGPYVFNAYGDTPPEHPGAALYDTKIHYGDYDAAGYDSYGYSAWYADGKFAGHGSGVDLYGYTEDDYLVRFDDDRFNGMAYEGKPRPVLTDRGVIGALRPVGTPTPDRPVGLVDQVATLTIEGLIPIASPLLGTWLANAAACELRPDTETLIRHDQVAIEADLIVTAHDRTRRGIRVVVRSIEGPAGARLSEMDIHAPILTFMGA